MNAAYDKFGSEPRILTNDDLRTLGKEIGNTSWGKIYNAANRAGRGEYHWPPVGTKSSPAKVVKMPAPKQVSTAALSVETNAFSENLIPAKDDLFVPFGNFKVVRDIIKSRMFYPIFITGLSGNGKTYMVEQACAATKREVIRVNFTVETDEDDLIGGFRLVDGETKFFKGPVIKAMEKGAVLLCDEIDLANPAKVMCLQSILEGNGYFIKKTGEYITPASGFTVVATANTKGKGSDDGRFIGTNILNEAFLERYPITCEQEYPSVAIERKILTKVAESVEVDDTEYVEKLTDWADIIRKTFVDGGVDEIISTRRLVHIVKAFAIFGDRMTAIEMCTNRFDEETKLAFRDLYTKLDAEVISAEEDEIESKDEIESTILGSQYI
jgi:MoxR-like ATPase